MSETPAAPVARGAGWADRKNMAQEGKTAAPRSEVLERVLESLLERNFVLTDRDGFITRWTPRAEGMFGLEAAKAAGQPLLESFGASEGEAPAAGRIEIAASHPEHEGFETELTFIPVLMSHSFEFNGFLESLEAGHPAESLLRHASSQHSDVLDWIGSVVADDAAAGADELTAGTIVVFRPLGELSWLEPVEAADAAPAPETVPAEPGPADAVDRAADVLARSDALERTLDEAGVATQETRAKADAAHQEATAAAQRVSELADENAALRAELDRARSELGELAGLGERVDALSAELGETRGATDSGHEAASAAAQRAEAALEAMRGLADDLLTEAREAREAASQARAEAVEASGSAAAEAEVARAQAEAARMHTQEAGAHSEAAREIAEAWAKAAERRGRTSDNGRAPAPAGAGKDGAPRVERQGFDDAPDPMAIIELDGRFRELNAGFSELVGYSESDFQTATWPPLADRGQLKHHREQMRELQEGETDSVEVNTGYLHAQGLLVPVAGTLSLVRDDEGEASHFLLAVRSPVSA
jgi:PAS domain S-box-containing protein